MDNSLTSSTQTRKTRKKPRLPPGHESGVAEGVPAAFDYPTLGRFKATLPAISEFLQIPPGTAGSMATQRTRRI